MYRFISSNCFFGWWTTAFWSSVLLAKPQEPLPPPPPPPPHPPAPLVTSSTHPLSCLRTPLLPVLHSWPTSRRKGCDIHQPEPCLERTAPPVCFHADLICFLSILWLHGPRRVVRCFSSNFGCAQRSLRRKHRTPKEYPSPLGSMLQYSIVWQFVRDE